MTDTYSCTYPNCGKVFSKAFELKKHKVTHEDPDRVFHCSECDFITLQKKNLGIHFAMHTGEKIHLCPDTICVVDSSGFTTREGRCTYKTNDPAALTKHRKKAHGYIPPLNRSRPRKGVPASPRKPQQKKDGRVSRRPPPSQRPLPSSCPKQSRVPEKVNTSNDGVRDTFTSASWPEDPSLFMWQGNADVYGQSTGPYSSNLPGQDYSISSNVLPVVPAEDMDLNALYDPSLQPDWMAKYEMSYSMFDMTGMKYLPEPHSVVPPLYPVSLDAETRWEGCLCPEWMVEAGIEGWDQSMLDTHRQSHV